MMGKYVLVTGGASGIGLAITIKLAESGYKVFCADINSFKGEDNKNIIPLKMDVTNSASIADALNTVKQHTDMLFSVINCAGIFVMNSVAEIEEELFKKILDVNLMGMFRVNKAFLPLLKGNYSKIINISSEIAKYSSPPFNGPYTISKYAVEAYSDALRRELMLLKIPVIKIRPGAIKTNMLSAVNKSFENLIETTKYFKESLGKMNDMLSHEINKTNAPSLIAKLVKKIIETKRPKIVYRIVNSKRLKFMGMLPERLQDKLYRIVVGGKGGN